MGSFRDIFTTTVTNASFAIPDGASEILIKNSGGGPADFTGTAALEGTPSSPVTIGTLETYTLGYIGAPRKGFTINAPATTIEITLTL